MLLMFVLIKTQSLSSVLCTLFINPFKLKSIGQSSGCPEAPQRAIKRIICCCMCAVIYPSFTSFLLIGSTLHHMLTSHRAPKSFLMCMEGIIWNHMEGSFCMLTVHPAPCQLYWLQWVCKIRQLDINALLTSQPLMAANIQSWKMCLQHSFWLCLCICWCKHIMFQCRYFLD